MERSSEPDVIVIDAWHDDELPADLADLHVSVEGSSLVTGQGVKAQVTSGLLGKSLTALYRLRVRARDLDRLAERIARGYPDTAQTRVAWLVTAIRLARQKADAAKAALGVTLLGVHRLTEVSLDEEGRPPQILGSKTRAPTRVRATIGFRVSAFT